MHTDCLKQIEMNRDLQSVAQSTAQPVEPCGKRDRPLPVERLEQMTRGFAATKRMFLEQTVSLQK